MEYIQEEIKIDIFSRLPTESVFNCRLVCKSWNDLLHLPYFADMHLHHRLLPQVDNVGFLFLTLKDSSPLCYLEYDERKRSYTIVKRIDHPPFKKRWSKIAMVGSCNGLICFSVPSPRNGIDDPIYVCNPLTNECTNLPKIDILRDYKGVPFDEESSYHPGLMVSGFGYHPLTKEYKIVRIIYYVCLFKKSGMWENIFRIPCKGSTVVDCCWPITLTFTGDLLLRREKRLLRYNRKTETIEELVEKIEDLGTDLPLYEGIHHTNSFVSLKALGEISTKIRQ